MCHAEGLPDGVPIVHKEGNAMWTSFAQSEWYSCVSKCVHALYVCELTHGFEESPQDLIILY
jgi:hypothetical protein